MNKIKKITVLLAITAAGALMAGSTNAALTVFQFDENGNSSQSYVGHQQAADSSTGITTLDYLWPLPSGPFFTLSGGWVAIYDDAGQTQLSDLVHFGGFVNNNQDQEIFFYSDDNAGALADNWLTTSQLNTVLASSSLVKISQNSAGMAMYTPATSAQPGYLNGGGVPPGFGYSYVFVSSVPEAGGYGAFASMLGLFCLGSGRVVQRLRQRHVAA
jgi:hypothetical protein